MKEPIFDLNAYPKNEEGFYRCPCCNNYTISEPICFDICQTCGWEDDGQTQTDGEIVRGGPNGELSLFEARRRHQLKHE